MIFFCRYFIAQKYLNPNNHWKLNKLEQSIYYAAAVVVAVTAAIISLFSALNSSRSAKAAMLGLTRKYEILIEHEVNANKKYSQSEQAFLVDVTFFNLGEVPVFLTAWLDGTIEIHNNKELNFGILTVDKSAILKPGEHQTLIFRMLTDDNRGKANITLNCIKKNSRCTPVEVKNPLPSFSV